MISRIPNNVTPVSVIDVKETDTFGTDDHFCVTPTDLYENGSHQFTEYYQPLSACGVLYPDRLAIVYKW
jgi:hypothetical protein